MILAESIVVHFKAVHFEVSKIISMDTDGYHFVKTIVKVRNIPGALTFPIIDHFSKKMPLCMT